MTWTILTLFVIVGTCAIATVAIPKKTKDDLQYTSTCGGELSANIGTISYKVDVPVAQNERCVWTIRSPTATSYVVDVFSLGLQPESGDSGIIATCISKYSPRFYNTTHLEINDTGAVRLMTPCDVLVLTFFTGAIIENSRGFSIVYTGFPGSNQYINETTKHYVVNTSEGHLRHPPSVEEQYPNHDVSTFVFPPLENIYNPLRKTVVRFVEDGLEENCIDYLDVLRFHPATGWTRSQRTCNETAYEKWESDDVIMVIFISNEAISGHGFHLIYSHELTSLTR